MIESNDPRTWKTIKIEHEGFPCLLRYPLLNTEGLPIDFYKTFFPELVIITHNLSKVSPNGLPDPDYNDSLMQFDCDIRYAFEEKDLGYTVLVETFGAKRRYYIYVKSKLDIDKILGSIRENNPNEQITWELRPDPEWSFIHKYSREYFPN